LSQRPGAADGRKQSMRPSDSFSNRLALDPTAAGDLRTRLRHDPQVAVKQAAQQFEGLLLHMMLKSMREATPGDGLLGSEQTRFFTTLSDQQLAQGLAAQAPLGFAGMIEKQLARQLGEKSGLAGSAPINALQQSLLNHYPLVGDGMSSPGRRVAAGAGGSSKPDAVAGGKGSATSLPSRRAFVDRVWPHAVEAAAITGVPPHFLVAHAALESGWGAREIRAADGSPSFNLFGIKAGRGWSGPAVEVSTTEFVNGVAQTERAKFRAYGSYAEAFRDYAQLLSSKSRYAAVIGQQDGAQFARALQQAGYATDPMYADKLSRIIGGATLRQALTAV